MHAQLTSEVICVKLSLKLHPRPYSVYTSREGTDETAHFQEALDDFKMKSIHEKEYVMCEAVLRIANSHHLARLVVHVPNGDTRNLVFCPPLRPNIISSS